MSILTTIFAHKTQAVCVTYAAGTLYIESVFNRERYI